MPNTKNMQLEIKTARKKGKILCNSIQNKSLFTGREATDGEGVIFIVSFCKMK